MHGYASATTKTTETVGEHTAAARYKALAVERQPYLDRARECAALTIPRLFPPEGHNGASELYKPWQSVGADCVSNLAAKFLMTLFPPGAPFFKLAVDDFVVKELAQRTQGTDVRGKLEEVLGKVEKAIVGRMETVGSRKVDHETLLHLIVGGNGLQHILETGAVKFFPLDRYVISRDLDDNVLEIVVKECIARDALPENIREIVGRHTQAPDHESPAGVREKTVEVYTWVYREEGSKGFKVHQEVCGEIVPGSEGSYPEGKSAWIPLRYCRVAGESYGRGRGEDFLADLRSLEKLTQAIVQFASVAAKVLCFVNEQGVTDKEQVAQAESGDVVDGDARDVSFLQLEKFADFQVAKATTDEIKTRLERGFLMFSSVQRQAERVTAEEIRIMANELEQGQGGAYSILAEEWQRPRVAYYLHILPRDKKSRVPKLPDEAVNAQIVTGLDGLGRNTDLQRIDALLAGTAQLFGPEEVKRWVNAGAYIKRRGAALGVDMTGLVYSDEEVAQSDQAAQQRGLVEKLGGPAIKAVSDNAIAASQQAAPEGGTQ